MYELKVWQVSCLHPQQTFVSCWGREEVGVVGKEAGGGGGGGTDRHNKSKNN